MATFCTNCGHELREGGKFCAECGTPVEGQGIPQTAPIGWEYCEITFSVKKGGFLTVNKGSFFAQAVGPKGTYEAARSPIAFNTGAEMRFGGYGLSEDDRKTKAAHEEVVQALVSSGWEPTGRGEWWWEYKFRRQVTS